MADADEMESGFGVDKVDSKCPFKMGSQVKVKEEMAEDDDGTENQQEDEEPTLGPAALGLQRVGTPMTPKQPPTTPTQVLNARGMPARIRKKNRMFYDDDIVNTPHHRQPSKKQRSSPAKKPRTSSPAKYKDRSGSRKAHSKQNPQLSLQSPDRKIGQKIGLRLRNVLKLPKAHKWVCFEWFYSDIDRCLFSGDNDFTICLKESFPELKRTELTRVEWTKIRRMMGKPRRCSQAFFNEERLELEKKRKKIRALQQRKATDLASFKDLPSEVPMQLVIGTKVTARLRKPQDGLFTGSIDAVDTSNNTYRITFERSGLGTHSVPDYEVLSNEPPETISLSTFQSKFRPRNGFSLFSPNPRSPPFNNLKHKKDPLLSGAMVNKPILAESDGRLGGFPTKLLEKMVLVTKILNVKKSRIKQLRHMNTEAEKLKSFEMDLPEDFQKKYANTLIDLEKLNADLQIYLDEMQSYCQEIAPEPSVAAMLAPSHLREKCREEAGIMVERYNTVERSCEEGDSILDLITELTALMLQVKSLADSDQNAYELQVLQGTMENIKRKLCPSNQLVFQDNVEVHMKHIQVGLSQAHTDKASSRIAY